MGTKPPIDLSGNGFIRDACGPISLRVPALRSRLSDEVALKQLSFRDHCEMLNLIKAGEIARLRKLVRTPHMADCAVLHPDARQWR